MKVRFAEDLAKPVLYWTPVVAPGNLMFYTSKQTLSAVEHGSGFIGGMATITVNRIVFDGRGGAKMAERWNVGKRIRDVEPAPDGSLWMVEDANPGALFTSRRRSVRGTSLTGPSGLTSPPRAGARESESSRRGVREWRPHVRQAPRRARGARRDPLPRCSP